MGNEYNLSVIEKGVARLSGPDIDIQFNIPRQIKNFNKILDWDIENLVLIFDYNGYEEILPLGEQLEEDGFSKDTIEEIKKKVYKINNFVKEDIPMTQSQKNKLIADATLFEEGFAFFSNQVTYNKWVIKVMDLDNEDYTATFEMIENNMGLVLDYIEGTFIEDKRKYEMLYNAEKHKEIFV